MNNQASQSGVGLWLQITIKTRYMYLTIFELSLFNIFFLSLQGMNYMELMTFITILNTIRIQVRDIYYIKLCVCQPNTKTIRTEYFNYARTHTFT